MGTGANFQPPLIALQSNISPQDNATATASLGLARSVASAVAVVVGSAAFARAMSAKREILRAAGGGDRVADLLSGSKAQGNLFVVETLDAAQRTVVQGVLYDALRNIWIETVCFCAAGLLACLLIEKKKLQKTHVEVKTGLEGEEARRKIAQEMRMKEKKNDSMA
ncbi:hypothetical protein VTK73DRAFT_10141 [Phialemonium thermophilum]|uniref:Uncharacterized protein n=1 Tax=Phialemonium thermophilum TaxID=223376 RepID=A0ABR3VY96_9PEZI